MTRLSLIEHDGAYTSFEINRSDLSKDAIEKIKWAIMKKSSEDINGGPIFGTGMFDSDGMMAVYLRKPIRDSNPNKAHREAIALIKEVLTEALNYVDQENNISIYANVCCKEAATALKDCLRDLEHL